MIIFILHQYQIMETFNMTSQRGRPPGYPKSGGSRKGSIKTNTKHVKDTIRQVFYDDLGGPKFLRKIAKNDPALFCSLLAKLIPQEIRAEVDINVQQIDLGAAMREANARLEQMRSIDSLPPVLEAGPAIHYKQICRT
jgi:hypothetical protein